MLWLTCFNRQTPSYTADETTSLPDYRFKASDTRKMSWIRTAVKGVHLLVLLLICGTGFYSFHVRCQQVSPDKQDDKMGALTIVNTEEQEENDGVAVVEIDDEITIENLEPFIATNEWQQLKPGQAIPRGLHVRMNIQTGEKEAKLLQEDASQGSAASASADKSIVGEDISFDELKKAVKSLKSEKFKSVDMETLKKEKQFRSYEELKQDMESINAKVKTDAEVITELVELFRSTSPVEDDVIPILSQLEYYLHQIDNAMLFCDLGAMPMLLKCLNNSKDDVRSEAALTLGSAAQSNPKVQISALENGAVHEILRLLAIDSSATVRKRAMYALSTMIRQFPFAQKRFLELGGLSVLGRLFDGKADQNLRIRAVTLLADLLKEKKKHIEHSNLEDKTQMERVHQYEQVNLEEAMLESGWCSLIPTLLDLPDHDSREKVLVAMETILPACRAEFQHSVQTLRTLQKEYADILSQEQADGEENDDGFFQGMISTLRGLLAQLAPKDEL
ncbi:nucleotide exchange factor SIL1-like isoform X1 [Littorina saxatilis]